MKLIELPIEPLVRITPSRFHVFKECRLRACWESAHVDGLLPPSPASHIGNVIHRIIEKAGKGEIKDIGVFELDWSRCVEEEEIKMSGSWIEKHLVPLEDTTPGFEVKKRQCKLVAERIIEETLPWKAAKDSKRRRKREAWLQTPDGKVGGFIDAIISTEKGDVVADFKSGFIDKPGEKDSGSVMKKFQIQLKLYAALYNLVYAKWPAALEVVGIDGASRMIEFTPKECLSLLKEASQLLEDINNIIANGISNQQILLEQLSSPSPDSCWFCPYRPGCPEYWKARGAKPAEDWPNDAMGLLKEMKQLGNGLILIKLQPETDHSKTLVIRGLHPGRHIALKKNLKRIAIFSMIPDKKNQGFYKEGIFTTIYGMG